MRTRTVLTAMAVALGAAPLGLALNATATPTAGAPATTPDLTGVRVLITNDDSAQGRDTRFGTDGRGLYELRKSLCAAGADVVVVAPWMQQSGASSGMAAPGIEPVPLTVAPMTVPASYAGDCADSPSAAEGPAVFGVCRANIPCDATTPSATPADATSVALTRFLADNYWADGPDVVLSGVNFGHNVAGSVNHSGTVGAVVTAMEHHVASIAVSAEVAKDLAKLARTPFAQTAAFTTDLLSRLNAADLLDADLALNVNYPFLEDGETAGDPVMTVVGDSNDIPMALDGDVDRQGGTYLLGVGAPVAEPLAKADITALRANKVSVTPLDGNWGAATASAAVGDLIAQWGGATPTRTASPTASPTAQPTTAPPTTAPPTTAPATVPTKRMRCGSRSVTRRGAWRVLRTRGGKYCTASRANPKGRTPSVRVSFEGDTLAIGYGRARAGGSADVIVDGTKVGKLSFKARHKAVRLGRTRTFTGLGDGVHKVTVVVSGRGAAFLDHFTQGAH